MSFYACMQFYRPGRAMELTGRDLAGFVRFVHELGIIGKDREVRAQLKFGRSPARDYLPQTWIRWLSPAIGEVEEIEYDLDEDRPGLREMAELLGGESRTIYRAHLSLGWLAEDVFRPVYRAPCPKNDTPFAPDSLALSIGPVDLHSFDLSAPLVGMLCVSLHGNGYLQPWTSKDFVERAERQPKIAALMSECRRQWPVTPRKPGPLEVYRRKRMGRLWPYDDLRRPMDWCWGVEE